MGPKVFLNEEIEWIHPGTGEPTFATVTGFDVAQDGTRIAINVRGNDFLDGASMGRLDANGNLKA